MKTLTKETMERAAIYELPIGFELVEVSKLKNGYILRVIRDKYSHTQKTEYIIFKKGKVVARASLEIWPEGIELGVREVTTVNEQHRKKGISTYLAARRLYDAHIQNSNIHKVRLGIKNIDDFSSVEKLENYATNSLSLSGVSIESEKFGYDSTHPKTEKNIVLKGIATKQTWEKSKAVVKGFENTTDTTSFSNKNNNAIAMS